MLEVEMQHRIHYRSKFALFWSHSNTRTTSFLTSSQCDVQSFYKLFCSKILKYIWLKIFFYILLLLYKEVWTIVIYNNNNFCCCCSHYAIESILQNMVLYIWILEFRYFCKGIFLYNAATTTRGLSTCIHCFKF